MHSQPIRRFSDSAIEVEENARERREDLIDLNSTSTRNGEPIPTSSSSTDVSRAADDGETGTGTSIERDPEMDITVHIPEVFLFEYGVVVIWGMSVKEEQRFLKEISKFEQEKLGKDDVQTEEFNFYYTREYQARIYNDFISLREKRNYMTKLAISHALAQSTKVRAQQSNTTEHELTMRATDQSIRGPPGWHNQHHANDPLPNRLNWSHSNDQKRNQHANRRTIHLEDQYPSPRFCSRCSGTHVGRTTIRACICCREKLFGNGSESCVVAGEGWCNCGFVGCAEGSVESYAW